MNYLNKLLSNTGQATKCTDSSSCNDIEIDAFTSFLCQIGHNKSIIDAHVIIGYLLKYIAFQRTCIEKLVSLVTERNKQETIIDINPETSNMKVKDTEWLTIDDTVSRYRLPRNNIKSRKWRIKNNFPYEGFDEKRRPYSSVIFHSKDIDTWIKNH